MKRIKKTPLLLAATVSLLASCSGKSIAGNYGFQLGKANGTHFGIFIKLKDEKYKTTNDLTVTLEPTTKALHVEETFTLTAHLSKIADDFTFFVRDGDETYLQVVPDSITGAGTLEMSCTVKGLEKGKGYVVARSDSNDVQARCHIEVFNPEESLIDPSADPDQYIDPRAKKCRFSFSAKLSEGGESEFENILEALVELFGDDDGRLSINGYYYEGEKVNHNTTELKFGIDFTFLYDIFDGFGIADLVDDLPTVPSDAVEQVIYSTYSNNTVTLYIPVSEEDLILQLYWYGHNITYSEPEGFKITELPEERHHLPGTHPSPDEVAEINDVYNFAADHAGLAEKYNLDLAAYRDYYTLAMGLLKD